MSEETKTALVVHKVKVPVGCPGVYDEAESGPCRTCRWENEDGYCGVQFAEPDPGVVDPACFVIPEGTSHHCNTCLKRVGCGLAFDQLGDMSCEEGEWG